ncbi:MAG: protein tyrosine phosphatase family protein [Arenicella sp.]|nr:protein tyrosine phosphatase family protein [Arenicella sp.]
MYINTFKTILGFFRSVLHRRNPFAQTDVSIDSIYNFLVIEGLFATSGQPSETQFELIRNAGYELVINLAPESVLENSLIDETQVLAKLGMAYVHIPVVFKKPTDDDFAVFVSSIRDNSTKKIWVHCAANMRVSAFTYRYRCSVLGGDERIAMLDLQKIWEPIGLWKTFINR